MITNDINTECHIWFHPYSISSVWNYTLFCSYNSINSWYRARAKLSIVCGHIFSSYITSTTLQWNAVKSDSYIGCNYVSGSSGGSRKFSKGVSIFERWDQKRSQKALFSFSEAVHQLFSTQQTLWTSSLNPLIVSCLPLFHSLIGCGTCIFKKAMQPLCPPPGRIKQKV